MSTERMRGRDYVDTQPHTLLVFRKPIPAVQADDREKLDLDRESFSQ